MSDRSAGRIERIVQFLERTRSPLAMVGLVLLGLYAILRNLLEQVQFGKLTPQSSASILLFILQYVFVIALVTIVLSIIAYVIPRIIPKSIFIPAPQLEYGLAIFRMIDPKDSSLAQVLQSLETFPGFPYYSRESDHPSAWPPRVEIDRHRLWESYAAFFQDADVQARLAGDAAFNPKSVQMLRSGPPDRSGAAELSGYIASARSHLMEVAQQGVPALVSVLGETNARRFVDIERDREDLRANFPNRLLVVRLHNHGRPDVMNLSVELEIAGVVYDHVIDADPDKVRKSTWDRDAQRVSFERLPSGYTSQVRVWYQYQSVSERVFPDKINFIHELTQGVRVANIAASRTKVSYNKALLEDFTGYERLYFGNAEKKDSYDDELAVLFEQQGKKMIEHMKRYDKTHPTITNLAPARLAETGIPDNQVTSIWLGFRSQAGYKYDAVHVFSHPGGPYILLASKDRNEGDMKVVRSRIAAEYGGAAKDHISDRSDDICTSIQVPEGFTQALVMQRAMALAAAGYTELIVSKLHYETE